MAQFVIVWILMIVFAVSLLASMVEEFGKCKNVKLKNYDKETESMYMYFAMHDD